MIDLEIKAAIDAMDDMEIFNLAVFAVGCAGKRANLADMIAVNNLCYDFIVQMHELAGTLPPPSPSVRIKGGR